jgi:hypothetical protein
MIKIEVKNICNKLDSMAGGDVRPLSGLIKIGNHSLSQDMNKNAIQEIIYLNIAEMAEAKINERRMRKNDLETI